MSLIISVLAISSNMAFAAGGNNLTLQRTYSGNIDYVATGASFRNTPNGTSSCSFVSPMASTVNLDLPAGVQIIDAFMYFSGSGDSSATYNPTVIDLSTQSGMTLNNVSIPTFAGFNERDFNDQTGLGSGVVDFFGARRDVSSIVTGPGAYTLRDMVVHTEAEGRPTTGTCLAAWALVVIYKDPAISKIRVINLFDGFQSIKNQTLDLSPRNFLVNPNSPTGKMTHISYEGDETISGGETFQFLIGNSGFIPLTNGLNSNNDQYNNTVSGPDVFDTSSAYGLDVDTYPIDSILASQPNEFQAQTRYTSGNDLVLLMTQVIAIDSKDLADIEVTLDDVGLFQENTTNASEYRISVKNNGDGTNNPSTGFATGHIFVYNDLPSGISIDTMDDIVAPGWDCSATNMGTGQIRCAYDLSTLNGGKLNRSDSLPDILLTVDVATPSNPATSIARVSLCTAAIDTCTTFDNKHTDSTQFDPLNFFELPDDLFDVDQKSIVNNNVDRVITSIVAGAPSDLSTSTKTVVDNNGGSVLPGDQLNYSINLIETNNVLATGVDIVDPIDTDTTSFSYTGTTCGGSPSNDFSFGTFSISGLTVPANGSCTVTYTVAIKNSAAIGTAIDNTANISNGNGTGSSPSAATQFVTGVAAGTKSLYLDSLGSGARKLTRNQPTSSSVNINNNNTQIQIPLSPVLQGDLDLAAGVAGVSLWIEGVTNGDYDVRVSLRYDSAGAQGTIGTQTISNITLTAGEPQLIPFQFNLASALTAIDAGEDVYIEVRNNSSSDDNIILRSQVGTVYSKVVLNATDVINVDTVKLYSDPARTNEIVSGVDTIESGEKIYVEAVVSDPFGAFDIYGATLTLIDPNLANQLTDVPMTEVTSGTTKTYTYEYTIPPVTSIDPGIWVAQVTGIEGFEGIVTHTNANSFETTAPAIDVAYTVDVLTADPLDVITYTITINNAGGSATSLDISQAAPIGTTINSVTVLPSGDDSATNPTTLDIQNIIANPGTTIIKYTVTVSGTAQAGDLIDHTISLDNMGTNVTDIAPSVLISPYGTPGGNKVLYGDNFAGAPRIDRTFPTSDTTRSINSQGGSTILVLSPVLQSPLSLAAGDIKGSVWVSRGASFAGQRTIQAKLAYTGAASGTIDTDSVSIRLDPGTAAAQYIPFTFTLGSPLVLPPNTSLTLTITNNTTVAGETITIHSLKDSIHPTRVALDAVAPLSIEAIEFFNGSVDSGGTPITSAGPNDTIWVRATVDDPFGAEDINPLSPATITVTNPSATVVANNVSMTVPTTQPASGAQKYFEFSYNFSSAELGDWNFEVKATEGAEAIVTATDSELLNVNNLKPVLTDSYKYVLNTTTGDNSNTNPGDTLHYTIELVETGGSAASNVSVSDVIPTNTTFTPGSLKLDTVTQPDPGGTINLTGLNIPANGSSTIEFDVTIDGGTSAGSFISNTADITNPNGTVTDIPVESEKLIIAGPPASGTKLIYLEALDTGSPYLTRARPATAGTGDSVVIQNGGGSVTLDLTPELAKAITLDPADGNIQINLRMIGVGNAFASRSVTVSLGYQNGGSVTEIGNVTQNAFLTTFGTSTQGFSIPISSITTIPAGNRLSLTVTNNQNQNNRDLRLYSYDSTGNWSTIAIVPDPVINVDSITFWTGTMGAGTQVSSPNPDNTDVDIYARIVISDPFGEADIQPPLAATNATVVTVVDPDTAVTNGIANLSCTAPCYAYAGEDTTNDPANDATRTFYYLIRINSDPPSTRGTWSVQVDAHEGLEGTVNHIDFKTFTTALVPNLSTSTKKHNPVGDIGVGDNIIYTVNLINSGAQDADNVSISDVLQTSPVALSFVSASTSCKDELGTALPNPTFASGTVTLSNISIAAAASCTVTITVSVGAGNPGDLIDNGVSIVNPLGPGATPQAESIVYLKSQVPVTGAKQLYLDDLNLGSRFLSRNMPNGTSQTTLDNGGGNVTINLDNVTTRAAILAAGSIDVNLWLAETGAGSNRNVYVELFVDPNDGGGFQSIDSQQQTLSLSGTPSLRSFNLTSSSPITLNPGASFRLVVQNNQNQDNRRVILSQTAAAPYSEVIPPLINSLQVTEIKYFDRSATDETGDPGCSPNCGVEITPPIISVGGSIWVRASIADAFGSFDVNTGCDGVTSTNCPTITITDPTPNDQTPAANELTYVKAPDTSSRQFEFQITPVGFGLEGAWTVEVEGTEGTESVIFNSLVSLFTLVGDPVLTIAKSVTGSTAPGDRVVYRNDINNTGEGPAINVVISNTINEFLALELVDDASQWTAVFSLSPGYTISSQAFDDGDDTFSYDPTVEGVCTLPTASPCYDPNIRKWRIELNESIPVGGQVIEEYRAKIQ